MHTILGTMTFSDQVDGHATRAMLAEFRRAGHTELDTAYTYNGGKTETLLGTLEANHELDGCTIASKASPWGEGGLTPASIEHQLLTSLQRIGRHEFDLYYLHAPDLATPIEQTLAALQTHVEAGRVRAVGLSNYASWQVAEVVELCHHHGWMAPTVYQGMYNALTRDIERELMPCLQNYQMSFYAYNPLAGGLLSGKHRRYDQNFGDGRFARVSAYQERYWKPDYFSVLEPFITVCEEHGITPAAAALRWLYHHSALTRSGDHNGVILGASSLSHLEANLQAVEQGPLPESIVTTLDQGWEIVRPNCLKYFRP